jgi:hypothetical protein
VTRRRRSCAALGAGLALAAAGSASATAVTPRPGTPDLAAMALQSTDFAPGAVAAVQGYVAPTTGFTAEYDGGFKTASTPDGVTYFSIGDFVSIATTTSTVNTFFNAESAFFRSKQGHKLLDKVIIAAAGRKAHLKARNIKYGSGGLSVGTGSSLETIGLSNKLTSVHEDVVLFEQGTVYVLLIMAANPGEKIPTSDASALATAIDDRIDTVLATGSTGPTGTTGATGSTG